MLKTLKYNFREFLTLRSLVQRMELESRENILFRINELLLHSFNCYE
ncbi:hypothetical protein V6N13_126943 [Hibiscus sabdariffa]